MASFDPNAYLNSDESAGFDPNAYVAEVQGQPGIAQEVGRYILGGLNKVGQTIDSYSGAPTRAALGSLQNDPSDWSGAASAFGKQFGADPNLAPTGKDIAARAGLSTDPILSPEHQRIAATLMKMNPVGFLADRILPGSIQYAASASPAGVAGMGVNVAADPLTYVPIGDIAEGAGKLAKGALSSEAEKLAVKATGATGKQAAEFAPDAGRQLLDRGLVKFGSSAPAMADRAADALEASGKNIGDVLSQLDAQGAGVATSDLVSGLRARASSLGNDPSKFSVADGLNRLADRIEAQAEARATTPAAAPTSEEFPDSQVQEQLPLTAQRRPTLGRDPSTGQFVAKQTPPTLDGIGPQRYSSEAAQLALSLPGPTPKPDMIPLTAAENTKRGFQSSVNWASSPNETSLAKEAADVYRQAVEDAATKANPASGQAFAQNKADYKLLAPIAEASQKRALQLQQSPHGGLLDLLAIGEGGKLGAMLGGGPVGAAIGGTAGFAAKQLRPRYASMGAITADALSNAAPYVTAGVAPARISALGTHYLNQNSAAATPQGTPPPPTAPIMQTPATGPDAWAQNGLIKLGIEEPGLAQKLLSDPKAVELLHQASDLPPNSRAMKAILNQINQKWGNTQ